MLSFLPFTTWGETRSLFRRNPTEDWAFLLFRCRLPGLDQQHLAIYLLKSGCENSVDSMTCEASWSVPRFDQQYIIVLISKKSPTDPWNIPQTLNYLFMVRKSFHIFIFLGGTSSVFQGFVGIVLDNTYFVACLNPGSQRENNHCYLD